MNYFRLGLFPLLGRRATGFNRSEFSVSRRIGDPCWGYQKIEFRASFSFPIFGWYPCDREIDRHINWVRAAYGLEPLEEGIPF